MMMMEEETEEKHLTCFLCSEPVLKTHIVTTIPSKFLHCFSRYAHFEIDNALKNSSNEFNFCENCNELGSTFCDLSFQLENIRLQLNYTATQIVDKMKVAKEQYSRVPSSSVKAKFYDAEGAGKDTEDLRLDLIKFCEKRLKSEPPKVLLKKIDQDQHPTCPVIKMEVDCIKTETEMDGLIESNQFVAGVLTFLAVFNLLLPYGQSPSLTEQGVLVAEMEQIVDIDVDDFESSYDGRGCNCFATRKISTCTLPKHSGRADHDDEEEQNIPKDVQQILFTSVTKVKKLLDLNDKRDSNRWINEVKYALETDPLFPNLLTVAPTKTLRVEWDVCILSAFSVYKTTNPYPAENLRVAWSDGCQLREPIHTINIDNIMKNGACLTSLVFHNIRMVPDHIRSILKCTPNLKAISFSEFDLHKPIKNKEPFSEWEPLPLLANLESFKIVDVKGTIPDRAGLFEVGNNLYTWFLEPNIKQLVSLETDNDYDNYSYGMTIVYTFCRGLARKNRVYTNLKRLQIHSPDNEFFYLVEFHSFPVLEQLNLTELKNNTDFQKLGEFLDTFCDTLEILHLDLDEDFKEVIANSNPDSLHAFKRIKEFTCVLPKGKEQADLINNHFLKKFPTLETLTLIHWEEKNRVNTRTNKQIEEIKVILDESLLLHACKNLKTVAVLDKWYEELLVQHMEKHE
ncbi:unnamed protein product [Orchesella dallaii]|uniref:Uncharacterized protein n=1 Tax=Orchesella dallaii TaxID=48710 RepID=A0ABP1RLZ2_9HEXA